MTPGKPTAWSVLTKANSAVPGTLGAVGRLALCAFLAGFILGVWAA